MKPIKQEHPRSEVVDWTIFIAILTALAFATGCGPKDIPSPSPMTKGAIAATDKSLDQAKSNLDKNDVPAAKGNIGDAKRSNSQAAIGHDATVKWYEVKVKERDDAIVDRDKVIEKDHKTLDKWYVKAVIAIAELIKWIIGISVFIGILCAINSFFPIPIINGVLGIILTIATGALKRMVHKKVSGE